MRPIKHVSISISMLGQEIAEHSPEKKLIISELIPRFNDSSYMPKIEDLNVRLKQVCANNNWGIITHRNIAAKQLNPYGLHLNRQGSTNLGGNFIEYFKHCSWQSITDVPINVEGDKNSTDSAMLETSASSHFSKLKGFKIGQISIASLVKHHDELLVYMQSKSLDVLTVNKTRLDIGVLDREVAMV